MVMYYVDNKDRVMVGILEELRNRFFSNDAMVFTKLSLKEEFSYLRKDYPYWKV